MRLRLGQRDRIAQRLKAMLVAPRPDYLATAEERALRGSIARLEERWRPTCGVVETDRRPDRSPCGRPALEHPDRITPAPDRSLQESASLNAQVEMLQKQYTALCARARPPPKATKDTMQEIRRQRRGDPARRMKKWRTDGPSGHLLETMAVNELSGAASGSPSFRSRRVSPLADSYDRATGAQTQEKVGR
jgi:hypothetical protein